MSEVTLTDSFGRRTVFEGDQLVEETTDKDDRSKPQWLDIDIWRTKAGSFVCRKATHYAVVHAIAGCPRANGYVLRDADDDDDYPCHTCNPDGRTFGWAQESRVTVDIYRSPQDLIDSLKVDGKFTRLSHALLAAVSKRDERVDALWNTVKVD